MYIKIKQNGFFIPDYDEDHLTFKKIESIFELLPHLNKEVEIEGTVTVRNILNNFDKEDLVVLGLLTNCSIQNFLHELDEVHEDADPLDEIVISKSYNIVNYNRFEKTNKLELEIDNTMHVVGKKNSETDNDYSLADSHWSTIADLPIKIMNEALFWDDRKHCILNKDKPEQIKTNITLNEFFHIFEELGWHSNPDERNEFIKDMKSRIDEIESGSAELIEWRPEDILKESNKKTN